MGGPTGGRRLTNREQFHCRPLITFVMTERKEVYDLPLCDSNHPHTLQQRKAQNREAQRAYRSRKDEQMKALKRELADMSKQLKAVTEAYKSARVENTLLSCVVWCKNYSKIWRRSHKIKPYNRRRCSRNLDFNYLLYSMIDQH